MSRPAREKQKHNAIAQGRKYRWADDQREFWISRVLNEAGGRKPKRQFRSSLTRVRQAHRLE